ncbi:MAG: DNA polymerase III chi subunit HolC [Rhodobacteraceae bacterium HLUCCA08]|nr:MAG: DNA polymerase III chi subunit HolC [Rhodobacteraceae bacterium HLUCCA08]
MGAVYFYQLSTQPLEAALPVLLAKAREAGWRVELRGVDAARMEVLDRALWSGPEDGFLPHGLAGGAHDADQPILLTCGGGAANAPACVMAVDGADIDPGEVGALERVCILFDGHDAAALGRARSQWASLVDAGCAAQYWSQDSGRWEKKAERVPDAANKIT